MIIFIPLLILIKMMGIRNLCLTERKIKIGQGFQSGNWGDQGNSTVIL